MEHSEDLVDKLREVCAVCGSEKDFEDPDCPQCGSDQSVEEKPR